MCTDFISALANIISCFLLGVCDEGRHVFADVKQEGTHKDVGLAVRSEGL